MAHPVLRNVLTAFSPRGDYLAVCAGDGRVKTWDAVNGSIKGDFADLPASTGANNALSNGHLAVDYTCMTWNPALKKGKQKHNSAFSLGLGTGSGDVILLDAALEKLKWKAVDCHPGGVKCVAFAKSGSILYSSGADGMVCELDVDSGHLLGKFKASKRAVSCIAVSEDGKYLVAGSSDLRLFDLSSKKRLCKFTGHPNSVKAIVYTGDDQYFLSSASGERHVALWHNDGRKKGAAASCSLSIEHPAVSVDCSGEFPGCLHIVAVSEAGTAYIWRASGVEELSKVKPTRIKVATSKGDGSPATKSAKSLKSAVLAAKFIGKNDRGPRSVLIVFGTTVKPVFEQILLEGIGNNILLQANENGVLMAHTQVDGATKIKGHSEAVIVGPDNAIDADKPRAHVELEEAARKPSKRKKPAVMEDRPATNMDGFIVRGFDVSEQDGISQSALDEGEETMEEKLKALGIMEDEGEDGEEKQDSLAPLKADSLQVLMTQALECDDKALLKQCLSVTEDKIIVKTVRMLSSPIAAKFLQMSVSQLDSRTKRALILVPWIKSILLCHASYIMSNPSMKPLLSSLYQIIDSRLSVFRPLLSLSGRLDLIMAQVVSGSDTIQQEEVAAAVVYEESDDDNEGDVEDVMDADMMEDGSDDSEEYLGEGNSASVGQLSDGSLDDVMKDSDDDDDL